MYAINGKDEGARIESERKLSLLRDRAFSVVNSESLDSYLRESLKKLIKDSSEPALMDYNEICKVSETFTKLMRRYTEVRGWQKRKKYTEGKKHAKRFYECMFREAPPKGHAPVGSASCTLRNKMFFLEKRYRLFGKFRKTRIKSDCTCYERDFHNRKYKNIALAEAAAIEEEFEGEIKNPIRRVSALSR